jgi:uncharacterized protein YjiS (DUF1127 family)
MASATQTSTTWNPPGAGVISRALAGFAARRAARARRARILYELSTYSDRQLQDLGFGRADFDAIADGTFRDRR